MNRLDIHILVSCFSLCHIPLDFEFVAVYQKCAYIFTHTHTQGADQSSYEEAVMHDLNSTHLLIQITSHKSETNCQNFG